MSSDKEDMSFIRVALEELLRNRQVLQRSYAIGFFYKQWLHEAKGYGARMGDSRYSSYGTYLHTRRDGHLWPPFFGEGMGTGMGMVDSRNSGKGGDRSFFPPPWLSHRDLQHERSRVKSMQVDCFWRKKSSDFLHVV